MLPVHLAEREIKERISRSDLTPDHLRDLLLEMTDDVQQADLAVAKFIIELDKQRTRAEDSMSM